MIVWLWVRNYGGTQVEVASELRTSTSLVSRWYGRAIATAPDIDDLAEAVAIEFGNPRRRPKQGVGSSRVRYQVDVDQ